VAGSKEFVSYLLDMLEGFESVRARAMFGGHGLYVNDLFSAIVVEDVLYIKADPLNRGLFEARGLPRFSYMKKGKMCFMSYFKAPEGAVDDPEALHFWLKQGHDAALRRVQNVPGAV